MIRGVPSEARQALRLSGFSHLRAVRGGGAVSMERIGSPNGYAPSSYGLPAYQGGRAVPRVVAPFARPVAPEVLFIEALLTQWRLDLLLVHGPRARVAAEGVRAGLVASWLTVADYPEWRIAQAEEYFGRLADAVEVAAAEDACARERARIERRCAPDRLERRAEQNRAAAQRYRDRKRSA